MQTCLCMIGLMQCDQGRFLAEMQAHVDTGTAEQAQLAQKAPAYDDEACVKGMQ